MKWFEKKFKSKNLELDLNKKIAYEKNNPVDWQNGKCCICDFFLEISKEITYLGFFIRKEHKFIRNILTESQLKKSETLKSLNSYYGVFTKFSKIFILLESVIHNLQHVDEIVDNDLRRFCEEDSGEFEKFLELFEEVKKFEVKKTNKKISKLTMQIIAFVYTRMMHFSKF